MFNSIKSVISSFSVNLVADLKAGADKARAKELTKPATDSCIGGGIAVGGILMANATAPAILSAQAAGVSAPVLAVIGNTLGMLAFVGGTGVFLHGVYQGLTGQGFIQNKAPLKEETIDAAYTVVVDVPSVEVPVVTE